MSIPPQTDFKTVMAPLIALAVRTLPSLPVEERSDIYEAISVLYRNCSAIRLADAAEAAAKALRDAQAHQLTFAALLKD